MSAKQNNLQINVEIVVAFGQEDQSIGSSITNDLPFRLPVDMKRFKTITKGHAVLMGTQTARSIGKALPGRTNYVLTRSGTTPFDDQLAVSSISEAIDAVSDAAKTQGKALHETTLFIIGGESVYREAIPYLTGGHLTSVQINPTGGDRFFPIVELEAQCLKKAKHGYAISHFEEMKDGEFDTAYWYFKFHTSSE